MRSVKGRQYSRLCSAHGCGQRLFLSEREALRQPFCGDVRCRAFGASRKVCSAHGCEDNQRVLFQPFCGERCQAFGTSPGTCISFHCQNQRTVTHGPYCHPQCKVVSDAILTLRNTGAQLASCKVDPCKLKGIVEMIKTMYAGEEQTLSHEVGRKLTSSTFAVHRRDFALSPAGRAHEIRIECPGVCEDNLRIGRLPNGVKVDIAAAVDGIHPPFEREFRFDDRAEGCYEFRPDESSLEHGLLRIILHQVQVEPQWFKLRSRMHPSPQIWSFEPVPERSEFANADDADADPPSEAFIGSESAVDEDVPSSLASNEWVRVRAAGRQTANPESSHIDQSALSDGSSSAKCYLPNTAFKTPDGNFLPVQNCGVSTQVVLSSGEVAIVTDWRMYDRDSPNKLVELITNRLRCKVSATHRIVVASSEGSSSTRLARDLKVGDRVLVGSNEQSLTKVIATEERGELFMLSFSPDEPVEAFPVPQWGLQTRGEPPLDNISEADLLQVMDEYVVYED